MTSRVSFSRLYKETLKRHYTSLLILVLAFVIHLITIIMSLQNYIELINEHNLDHYYERILSTLSPNYGNGLFALVAGLFLAFDFFRYLHSKMQTDFYESLPVRKIDHFSTNMICAISSFAFLSVVTFGLELLIANIFGYGSIDIFRNILWNLVCTNLCFIASFVTATLAWVMTGHPIIALVGYGAFVGYVPILLYNLYPTFASAYFDTYVRMPIYTKINWNNLFNFLSPGSLMVKLCESSRNVWTFNEHITFFIAIILFSVIIGYLAFILYKKRPNEAAGRAMAFEKANAPIRILVVIPIALYAGLLLQEISSNRMSVGWLIFGIIFVGFIVHGLMEAIFEADVRAAFRKKKQLLLSYVICFTFLAIFWFDPFHYNEYIPNENKVVSVHIYSDNFIGINYMVDDADGLTDSYVKPALEVAKDITSLNHDEFSDTVSIDFEYELKNGMIIAREYLIDIHNIPESLDRISTEDAFKDDISILYHVNPNIFLNLHVQSNYGDQPLDNFYTEQIFKSYMKEFKELSISDSYNTPIECQLVGEYIDKEDIGGDYDYLDEETVYMSDYWFPIYSSFEETISLMKKAGYIPFQENEDITITRLDIYSTNDNMSIEVTDPAVLEQLKPYMRLNDYNYFHHNTKMYNGTILVDSVYDDIYWEILIDKDDFHSIVK